MKYWKNFIAPLLGRVLCQCNVDNRNPHTGTCLLGRVTGRTCLRRVYTWPRDRRQMSASSVHAPTSTPPSLLSDNAVCPDRTRFPAIFPHCTDDTRCRTHPFRPWLSVWSLQQHPTLKYTLLIATCSQEPTTLNITETFFSRLQQFQNDPHQLRSLSFGFCCQGLRVDAENKTTRLLN